jgi:hypothetical protein
MTYAYRQIGLVFVLSIACLVDAHGSDRYALVIGNQRYQAVQPLRNPVNDANAVSRALGGLGFEVTTLTDLDRLAFYRAVQDFVVKLTPGSVAWFYYAGHGMQVDGINYLVPVDAQINGVRDVKISCVPADDVLGELGPQCSLKILALDCCRNNPFLQKFRSLGGGSGLGPMDAPTGTMLVFSTACGAAALDGAKNNSPFTAALCEVLDSRPTQGLELKQAVQIASTKLKERTRPPQIAWVHHEGALASFTLVPSRQDITVPNTVFKLPIHDSTQRSKQLERGMRVAVTAHAPNKQNEWFNWQNLKAKYVLIAFYGHNCAPCRAEIARIKEAYVAYPDRTLFDVVGMDLDRDSTTRERLRREWGIEWENIWNEPKKVHPLLAPYYDLTSEPRAMLVEIRVPGDKGTVVEVSVSGDQLMPILQKYLGPPRVAVR